MAEAHAFVWSLQSSVNDINFSSRGSVTIPNEMSAVLDHVQGMLPADAQVFISDDEQGLSTVVEVGTNNNEEASSNSESEVVPIPSDEPAAAAAPESNNSNAATNNANNNNAALLLRKLLEGKILLHIAFVLILLARMLYEHFLGIAVFIALYGAFCQANSTVKKLCGKRDRSFACNRTMLKRVWVLCFPAINIFLIYYVFSEQKLLRSLYFQLPEIAVSGIDIFTLLWIVCTADLVVKYLTIELKALLLFIPHVILPRRLRGQFLSCVEEISRLYRNLIPLVPWVNYVTDSQHVGNIFSIFLLVIYTLFKGYNLWFVFKTTWVSMKRSCSMYSLGRRATRTEVLSIGDLCAICHDAFTEPVLLKCGHIFCDECLTIWFDREQTCPMCRKSVVDKPLYRDGGTEVDIQWY